MFFLTVTSAVVSPKGSSMSVRYVHDCDDCLSLGTWNEFDLYVCIKGDTYVARYGNDGWEYLSGKIFAGLVPAITAAHKAAGKANIALTVVHNASDVIFS